MSNESKGVFTCPVLSWIAGGLIAIAAYLVLHGRLELGVIFALLIAVVIGVALALGLMAYFCKDSANVSGHATASAGTSSHPSMVKEEDAVDASAAAMRVAAMAETPPPAAAVHQSAEALAAAEETTPVSEPDPVAPHTETSPDDAETPAAKAQPVAEPAGDADKPELFKEPVADPDNLKEIKGVGPKLEKMLNELGVWKFSQIASWSEREVAWVDDNLVGFKGRIVRDNWVEQAKVLAAGGETEFSKRVEDGDVY